MYFYRKIITVLYSLFVVSYFFFIREYESAEIISKMIIIFGFFICATYYKIENGFLYKRILGIPLRTLRISEIQLIEIVKVNQATRIKIRIGAKSQYDGFYLKMKDGTKYKLNVDFTNRNNIELGIYFIKNEHVKSRQVEKSRLFIDKF